LLHQFSQNKLLFCNYMAITITIYPSTYYHLNHIQLLVILRPSLAISEMRSMKFLGNDFFPGWVARSFKVNLPQSPRLHGLVLTHKCIHTYRQFSTYTTWFLDCGGNRSTRRIPTQTHREHAKYYPLSHSFKSTDVSAIWMRLAGVEAIFSAQNLSFWQKQLECVG